MAQIVDIEVQAKLQWRANQSASSGRWIGVCESLDLAIEADSLDELHGVIQEALQLLLTDLLEDDELAQYLRSQGWRAANIPSKSELRDVEFRLPWQLISEGAFGTQPITH